QRRGDAVADGVPAHAPLESLPLPPARCLPMLGVYPAGRRRARHVRGRGGTYGPRRPGRGMRHLVSTHVDVTDLDGVVAVAEAVPEWHIGLHVALCVGRTGAKGAPPWLAGVPIERPVLPLIRAFAWLEGCRMPVHFPRPACVDMCHRPRARPRFPPHGIGADPDDGAGSGVGDAGAHAHGDDGVVWPVGPLVHVMADLELAGVVLGENLDAGEPFHRCDAVPVG